MELHSMMKLHRKRRAKVRLTSTDKKHICQTLTNVREMLSRDQVVEYREMALWDLLNLEGSVEPDYPGSRKILHALCYVVDLKRIRAMPLFADGYDYVDYYLKQIPLRLKYQAIVLLLNKSIILCGKGGDSR